MSARNDRCSRRQFLRIAGAGAALAAIGCRSTLPPPAEPKEAAPAAGVVAAPAAPAAPAAKRIPIALELYSVRNQCEKDLPGVLAQVKKMGYEGVEFAGYYGRDAKELRALLDANGLVCCGTHTGIDTLQGDKFEKTVEFNRILGNRFLIVPGLPGEMTASADAWKKTAEVFKELAVKAKAQGMRVGYHNHSAEFKPVDGGVPWDIFFDNAGPDVVMQVDIGNALSGGADPLELVKKHPGRSATVHIKEFSKTNPTAAIGEGEVNWPEMLKLLRTQGATEWFIVEYESDPEHPMEGVARCIENLKKL